MFSSRNDHRSLFHHHHDHHRHHNGPALFGVPLSRLRPALYYFMFAVVITTFLYCLLFYEPDSARHHPHRRLFRHYQSSKLISSSSSSSGGGTSAEDANLYHQSAAFLLEEFIRNANVHFAEYYRRRMPLVPPEVLLGQYEPLGTERQKNQRSLLNNSQYDTVTRLTNDHNNTRTKGENVRIQLISDGDSHAEIDDTIDDEDEDYLELVDDPDSIEHYLEQLGFNIRHITRYLLHNNQSTNASNSLTKSPSAMTTTLRISSSKSTSTSSSKFVQSLSSNLSSFSDILELFGGIKSHTESENGLLVFVTAISVNQYSQAYRFIKSFERYRQMTSESKGTGQGLHLRLMIYDLGLSEDQLFEVETLCNTTWGQSVTTLCKIRKFRFDLYPSHVSDIKVAAYRSIILQEMLRDIRRARLHIQQLRSESSTEETILNLFWLDPHYRFLSATIQRHPFLLTQLLSETRNQSGISSWPIEQPTSSLTTPRMFEYFHTTADNFYFHRMIRSSHLVLSIGESTWQSFELGVMLPWVRCALTDDCISPLGSQWRSSCRLDKKPHYRYSGCHHYDMSALNVVLGIAFNLSSSDYSAAPSSKFFAPFYKLKPSTPTKSTNSFSTNTQEESQLTDSKSTIPEDDFDYPNFDPDSLFTTPIHRMDDSLLESEERFDRVLTDDDLPSEQRRPAPVRPVTSSTSPSSSLLSFHQESSSSSNLNPRPKSSLLSSSLLSSTSPEESMHPLKQRKSL